MSSFVQARSSFTAAAGGMSPPTFRISFFTNDRPVNERGTTVTSLGFNWDFLNGVPIDQSIEPTVGVVPNASRSTTATVNISDDTVYTLTASDGERTRTMTTVVRFVYPHFAGVLVTNNPTAIEVQSMLKIVSTFEDFQIPVSPSNEFIVFWTPVSNPIRDIGETLFGTWISRLSTYNQSPLTITMLDGVSVPGILYVSQTPMNAFGFTANVEVRF